MGATVQALRDELKIRRTIRSAKYLNYNSPPQQSATEGRVFRFADKVSVSGRDRIGFVVNEFVGDTSARIGDTLPIREPRVQIWFPGSRMLFWTARHGVRLTASEEIARQHSAEVLSPSDGPPFKFELDEPVSRLIANPLSSVLAADLAIYGIVASRYRIPSTPLTNWYTVLLRRVNSTAQETFFIKCITERDLRHL